ncbi:glycosyltransferase [Allorhodopirellula solitaria]|uniref:GDP-mannose-dependent alpha-(1-6)-phosphatidylinositol monomannoside mannosyltransferase n=1 Tax=Allorhodopirellula solitaria TaxID=2527987 RepID=A0A5C5X0Q0_9BACT|nr:glycosyltransferase [Allorhodopirellula solitaria]TWT55861.1 GDP-mannose-dependent alpha-(1-6)-phosphatidylinositol monomannoside mannosyltransferase [Allorhodopirellula solitaria]
MSNKSRAIKVCLVRPSAFGVSETFIDAHASRVSSVNDVLDFRASIPYLNGRPVLSQAIAPRALRKIKRILTNADWNEEIQLGLTSAFKASKASVVLAEYGMTAVKIQNACEKLDVPFIAHFHGYDASKRAVLEEYAASYHQMFQAAAAVIAVSRAMESQLLKLGCPRNKLIYNPYGVSLDQFSGATPQEAERRFIAVGRFVEKKAPQNTLLAFSQVVQRFPDSRLIMIGDGILLNSCRELAAELEITHAVDFLGEQPHHVVNEKMRTARAFVQHSVTAKSGDSEGTPNAVLEAGASGLPVVATRHAGIPDVVVDGETGLLVDEGDIDGMAAHMQSLAQSADLAGKLGRKAAAHIANCYTMEHSINRLERILEAAAERRDMDVVRNEIDREFPSSLNRSNE